MHSKYDFVWWKILWDGGVNLILTDRIDMAQPNLETASIIINWMETTFPEVKIKKSIFGWNNNWCGFHLKIRYNNLTQSDTVVLEVNFTFHIAFVVSNIIQVWYHWDISIESEMLIISIQNPFISRTRFNIYGFNMK